MSSEGSDVSIWISRSLAEGKIVFRSPRIGETASPGNDVTADTDQIANSTGSEIVPLPVDIFMVTGFGFLGLCRQPLCQRLRLAEAAVFADVVGCGKRKRIGVFMPADKIE